MKNDCVSNQSCFLSACCTLNAFQLEVFLLTLIVYSIAIAYTFISYHSIISNIPKEVKNAKQDANSKLCIEPDEQFEYIGDRLSFLDKCYIYSHILIKTIILTTIIIKAFYMAIANYFLYNDIDEDSELFSFYYLVVLDFFILIFIFFIFYIPGYLVEFYKKYLLIFIGFSLLTFFNYTIYRKKTTSIYESIALVIIACIIGLIITLFLIIYSNSLYFSKVNRDDSIKEENLSRYILENYSNNLNTRNEIELYKETNRVFDLYKIVEIIKKIRNARK